MLSLQACVDAGTYYWLFNMPVALAFTGEAPVQSCSVGADLPLDLAAAGGAYMPVHLASQLPLQTDLCLRVQ